MHGRPTAKAKQLETRLDAICLYEVVAMMMMMMMMMVMMIGLVLSQLFCAVIGYDSLLVCPVLSYFIRNRMCTRTSLRSRSASSSTAAFEGAVMRMRLCNGRNM